ncbi:HesB/YadR/YfhF family protein [Bacillus sp. OVS6]|nr:HesB/YadR/YfhF family protein [Bacillus sp. OVS6]
MNIHISGKAAEWYQNEMNVASGDSFRFFVRYGGTSTIQKGFSLGVVKDQPKQAGAKTEKNGITFFIEESDIWYFDQNDLVIDFDEEKGNPYLIIKKPQVNNLRFF